MRIFSPTSSLCRRSATRSTPFPWSGVRSLGRSRARCLPCPCSVWPEVIPGRTRRFFARPMSREERDFLSSCIRCTECVKACPTGILKAAGLEHGIRAFWTPIMVPTEGYCKQGCNACSEACPTDAIMKYPIEKKYNYKSGTAVFNSSKCVSYTENKFCEECVRVCPTKAIETVEGWRPPGETHGADAPAPAGQTAARPIHVNYERCIGCGACEYECNKIVFGEPAMITTSFGRATPSKLGDPAADAPAVAAPADPAYATASPATPSLTPSPTPMANPTPAVLSTAPTPTPQPQRR